MKRIEGEPCPYCGSKRNTLLESVSRLGKQCERRQCSYCDRTFRSVEKPKPEPKSLSLDPDDPVIYTPRPVKCECPACGAPNPRVTNTKKNGIRHHKCKCGQCFKSREVGKTDT